MGVVADIASAISALISTLTLVRTTSLPKDTDEDLRPALYELHAYLELWNKRASATNAVAHSYVDVLENGLPLEVWEEARHLHYGIVRQLDIHASGRMLSEIVSGTGGATLLTVLQIHANDLHDLDRRIKNRMWAIGALREELDSAHETGGRAAVDERLQALNDRRDQLSDAANALGAFIRERFPVGRAPAAGEPAAG